MTISRSVKREAAAGHVTDEFNGGEETGSETERHSYRLHLGPNAYATVCARRMLARNLATWRLTELLDDAGIVTTELVANAARQGDVFTLDLSASDSVLLIEVSDHSPDEPVLNVSYGDDDAEDGRGLFLVDVIADEWGVRWTDDGKTVWASVSRP